MILPQIGLRVTGPIGWTVKIQPDYLMQTLAGWEINEAKFNAAMSLASPDVSLVAL